MKNTNAQIGMAIQLCTRNQILARLARGFSVIALVEVDVGIRLFFRFVSEGIFHGQHGSARLAPSIGTVGAENRVVLLVE